MLGDKLTKGAITALQKPNDSWEWKVGLGGRPARGDQDDAVRELFEATNALLEHLYPMTGEPLVLVVDGLDRVQGIDVFLQLAVALLTRGSSGDSDAVPALLRSVHEEAVALNLSAAEYHSRRLLGALGEEG